MAIYSHSKLSCYQTCPKAFFFKYVKRARPLKVESAERLTGWLVHKALENLYLKPSMQKNFSCVQAFFQSSWKARWHDKVVLSEGKNPEYYKDHGEKCLESHWKYFLQDSAQTVATEKRVFPDLFQDGKYKLVGVIDRIAVQGNTLQVHDYKTSSELPSFEDLESNRQAVLYKLGASQKWSLKTALYWHFLSFGKIFRFSPSEKQVRKVASQTASLIDEVEHSCEKQRFDAKKSEFCVLCEFQLHCIKPQG
ncbi:MAG: RecB family exonuclease [Candidatus Micrarchaeia archaeon]